MMKSIRAPGQSLVCLCAITAMFNLMLCKSALGQENCHAEASNQNPVEDCVHFTVSCNKGGMISITATPIRNAFGMVNCYQIGWGYNCNCSNSGCSRFEGRYSVNVNTQVSIPAGSRQCVVYGCARKDGSYYPLPSSATVTCSRSIPTPSLSQELIGNDPYATELYKQRSTQALLTADSIAPSSLPVVSKTTVTYTSFRLIPTLAQKLQANGPVCLKETHLPAVTITTTAVLIMTVLVIIVLIMVVVMTTLALLIAMAVLYFKRKRSSGGVTLVSGNPSCQPDKVTIDNNPLQDNSVDSSVCNTAV